MRPICIDHQYADSRIEKQCLVLHHCDPTGTTNLSKIVQQLQPDEIHNLAARSYVAVSFGDREHPQTPEASTLRFLEGISSPRSSDQDVLLSRQTFELRGTVRKIPKSLRAHDYPE